MRIVIPGEPVAQGRPRLTTVNGHARAYDPARSRNWKATAQQHMRDQMDGDRPLDGPLNVTIIAVFTMPKSRHRKRDPRPREWHTKKPDADNVAKAVKDAATGVLWLDDKQVAVMNVVKITGEQGEAPGITVDIEELAAVPAEWAQQIEEERSA